MKALILAAGRGSRLHPLTESVPKCLISLLNKPLIEWQLEALQIAGIKQTLVVTGFQRERLLPYFDFHFHNENWASTNMAFTLLQADSLLKEHDVLICYSDIVFHPSIIKSLIKTKSPITITYDIWWKTLWEERFANPLDDAESFKLMDGKLIEIGEKPLSLEQIEGQYMGLIKIKPCGWDKMKPLITPLISLTELLNQMIKNNQSIDTLPVKGKWCEVDRIEDLKIYEKRLLDSSKWPHDFRWEL